MTTCTMPRITAETECIMRNKIFNNYYARMLIYIVLAWAFVVGSLLLVFVLISSPVDDEDRINDAHFTGTYILGENGEPFPFRDLDEIDVGRAGSIAISGHFTEPVPAGNRAFIYMYREHVRITKNDHLVYDNEGDYLARWESFGAEGITPADRIGIYISKVPGSEYSGAINDCLDKMCVGTRYGLIRDRIAVNFVSILVSTIIFVFALVGLAVAFVLNLTIRTDARGAVSCGLLLLFGSGCCFIDYDYVTLLFGDYKSIESVDLAMQVFTVLFLMVNMYLHMTDKIYKRIAVIVGGMWTSAAILYTGLVMTHTPINDNLWTSAIALAMIVSVAAYAIMQFIDCRRIYRRDGIVHGEMVSNIILSLFTIVEVWHYMMSHKFIISVFEIGLTIYAIFQFIMMVYRTIEYTDKARRADELEKQSLENQMSIMLSQIQPHFLYNVITAIQMLCIQDARAAQRALGDFASYLRGNMDSLKSARPIPFERELEHTRHYVELELIRQGEYLDVKYDINYSDFGIPALSLQAIVENAIKHGVGNHEDGGQVSIETHREADAVVITVEDDGVGFEVGVLPDDGRSHVGLENVSRRLHEMCRGTLEVRSTAGAGTRVIMKIPLMNQGM